MTVARRLAWVAGALSLAHVGVLLSRFGWGHGRLYGLLPLFDLDQEQNLPTFFSGALFLANAALLALIWRTRRSARRERGWAGLACLFCFLAFDELLSVHETLILPVREAYHLGGPLYYAWVVPYVLALAVLSLAYIPFWVRLDPSDRRRIGLSAAVYLSGAVGLELVEVWYADLTQERFDLVRGVLTGLEESLEMAGLIIFLYSLLRTLESQCGELRFVLTSADQAVNATAADLARDGDRVVPTAGGATNGR